MTKNIKIRNEVIQRFGDAYRSFGLNKLMGNIVALLLYAPAPLSLDEIAETLGRSKGPISQIVRRLKDKHLIRKVWAPENNRKDYYEIEPDIFENSFRNNLELVRNNIRIAASLKETAGKYKSDEPSILKDRMLEMERFHALMEKHYLNFLTEWVEEKKKI